MGRSSDLFEGDMKRILIPAIALLSIGTWAIANAQDYKCKVERITGSVEQDARRAGGHLLGQEFSVDRISGVMVGPPGLKNSFHTNTQPKIIDSGSKENSFKVVATRASQPGSQVYVLVVEEWREGPFKPFTFLDGSSVGIPVFFGTCRHVS